MEILLLVVIMVVAASGLYVATTFNKRTERSTAPLRDGVIKDIAARIEVTAGDLRQQLQAIANALQKDRALTTQNRGEVQSRLDQADSRISSISSQFLAAVETFERLGEQIHTRAGDLRRDLQQRD